MNTRRCIWWGKGKVRAAPGVRHGWAMNARETESEAVDFYMNIGCGQLAWKRGRGPHFLVDNSQIEGWILVKYYVLRIGSNACYPLFKSRR